MGIKSRIKYHLENVYYIPRGKRTFLEYKRKLCDLVDTGQTKWYADFYRQAPAPAPAAQPAQHPVTQQPAAQANYDAFLNVIRSMDEQNSLRYDRSVTAFENMFATSSGFNHQTIHDLSERLYGANTQNTQAFMRYLESSDRNADALHGLFRDSTESLKKIVEDYERRAEKQFDTIMGMRESDDSKYAESMSLVRNLLKKVDSQAAAYKSSMKEIARLGANYVKESERRDRLYKSQVEKLYKAVDRLSKKAPYSPAKKTAPRKKRRSSTETILKKLDEIDRKVAANIEISKKPSVVIGPMDGFLKEGS